MKTMLTICGCFIFFVVQTRADIKVISLRGDIQVRHGIQEGWQNARPGDVLKPDDSMRSGRRSSATILIDDVRTVNIPESVMVDLSDLRMLTREELLLGLAMEGIRSVPVENHERDIEVPRTTTIHGMNRGTVEASRQQNNNRDLYSLQLNGTSVLYEQGFYATCILRAKELFRLDSTLSNRIYVRLMVADAMEKMMLRNEALNEYSSIGKENLSPADRFTVEQRIKRLKS